MFNGIYYKQVDGLTMGPTLANLFLSNLERNWMSFDFSPVIYKRYVDDIFCVFRNESDSSLFFELINKAHKNLKFTFENHSNNQLPFLDVNVILKDSDFETSVFRKSTFTGLMLNFQAVCPIEWKKGLVIGMLHRA